MTGIGTPPAGRAPAAGGSEASPVAAAQGYSVCAPAESAADCISPGAVSLAR